MNNYFIILAMIFLHILDDFVLQNFWLSSGKQKKMWKEAKLGRKYEFDYLCALCIHGFSWAFMMMLPIAAMMHFCVSLRFVLTLIANALLHAAVDDAKANRGKLNLWQDQLIHLWQISLTAIVFLV